jgi:hypothetical protein
VRASARKIGGVTDGGEFRAPEHLTGHHTAIRREILPTSAAAIGRALDQLRGAPLLQGARGRPAVDRGAVVRAAQGLAALAEDLGDRIAAVDVNPLVALPDRAVVVDALVVARAGSRPVR